MFSKVDFLIWYAIILFLRLFLVHNKAELKQISTTFFS